MPHLQDGRGLGTQRSDAGSSNLPQLKEGQLYAADFPDRSGHSHAQAPPGVAPRGGGKKKNSSHDPNNPYSSKPSGSKAKKNSGAWGKAGHSSGASCSSSQMGVVGQAQSIAGLAAAYALPPSSMAPPRTPSHDQHGLSSHLMDSAPHLGPPRTPQEGSSSMQFGLEAQGYMHGGKLHSSQNYSGGQYAKYGKRY